MNVQVHRNKQRYPRSSEGRGPFNSRNGGNNIQKQGRGQLVIPQPPKVPFAHRARPIPDDLSVLKPLPSPLFTYKKTRNTWDVDNQARLMQIEHDWLNGKLALQTTYDTMTKMREAERPQMERLGLVDSKEVRKSLSEATNFIGSCMQMCPVYERVRRSLEGNVYQVEKQNGEISSSFAVKAFSRPAAGVDQPLPSDVRPPEVLVKTLEHLALHVLPQLPQNHTFLWDRTRAIRQDFTFQNYQGPEAIQCFEVIARIHCVVMHVMAEHMHANTLGKDDWSQQQEIEQLNKCLQSLSEFYNPNNSKNEGEMRAYQLILDFFDEQMVAETVRNKRLVNDPLVELALELRESANVSAPMFFRRLRQPDVPLTLRALAEINFNKIRLQQARMLHSSLHPRFNMYPLPRFQYLLGFNSANEAREFCNHYHLIISTSEEAGEEVDMSTWNENGIRDATQMRQPIDPELNMANIDVYAPQLNAESLAKLNQKRAEMQEQARKAQEQKEQELRDKERLQKQEQERLRQMNEQRLLEQRLLEQKREQEQARKLAEEQKAQEIQRQMLQKQMQEQIQAKQMQKRLEEQQLRQQAEEVERRRSERQAFINTVSNSVLASVLASTVHDATEMAVKVAEVEKRIAKKRLALAFVNAIKRVMEPKRRRKEVLDFFSNKRQRLVRAPAPVIMPSKPVVPEFEAEVEAVPEAVAEPEVNKYRPSDWEILQTHPKMAETLEKAAKVGIGSIRCSFDPATKQGYWLQSLLGHRTLSISNYRLEFVEFPLIPDLVLVGEGGTSRSALVFEPIELGTDVEKLINSLYLLVGKYEVYLKTETKRSRTFWQHHDTTTTTEMSEFSAFADPPVVDVPLVRKKPQLIVGTREWLRSMIDN